MRSMGKNYMALARAGTSVYLHLVSMSGGPTNILPSTLPNFRRDVGVPTNMVPMPRTGLVSKPRTLASGGFGQTGAGLMGALNVNALNTSAQVTGMETNDTVAHTLINSAYKSGVEESLRPGDMVFAQKMTRAQGEMTNLVSAMSLSVLNFILAAKEAYAADHSAVKTAEQLSKEWTFLGIVNSEDSPEYGGGNWGGHRRINSYHILNNVVKGRVLVHNIWTGEDGNAVAEGDALWLLVRRVSRDQVPNSFVLTGDGHQESVGAGVTRTVFQVTPYSSSLHKIPPLMKRFYTDDFGYESKGLAWYVGKARHQLGTAQASTKRHALTSVTAMHSLPMIEIIADV